MPYHLLAGGYRSNIALLSFDNDASTISVVSETPTPPNPSWIEPSASRPTTDFYSYSRPFYTLSEDEMGLALSLHLQGDKLEITGQRKTLGGPAHIHAMKDGSGIVVSNYVGGSIIFFPIDADGKLSADSESPLLSLPFPYGEGEGKTPSPNPDRQEAPHAHQVIEGAGGLLFVADLGSDRVWLVERDGASALKIVDYIQCPPNWGPRHLVLSSDGKLLYVLGEMGHAVKAYPVPATSATPAIPDLHVSILPPSVPVQYTRYMDAAEIYPHPSVPGVLYVSNRLELHVNSMNKDLAPLTDQPDGDAVAIILLGPDGTTSETVTFVRTGCDSIRAMQISPDGKYAAVAGQRAGGVEIYSITGDRADKWTLVAKQADIEQVTDFVWL